MCKGEEVAIFSERSEEHSAAEAFVGLAAALDQKVLGTQVVLEVVPV